MTETASVAELIPIKSETRTVQSCFQNCLYEVPDFQRPYAWDEEKLSDYWHDVVMAEGDFFFGSTVTWLSKQRELFNDSYSIIDGQQRLTTSAIALSVVRDSFQALAKKVDNDGLRGRALAQAAATQKYLIATDDEGLDYPVIERPEEMFYHHILKPDAIPSTAHWTQSAERIGDARKFFEQRILARVTDLSDESVLEELKLIRSNILKARLIQVELLSEEDGFLVFETLNNRGLDLRLSDLVKNLLVRDGARSRQDRQTVAQRWNAMANAVEATSKNPDVLDRFLWQSWNSRRPAVKVPEVYKELTIALKAGKLTHLGYLKELEEDSRIYCRLDDLEVSQDARQTGIRNAFAEPEFIDALRALALFDVTVAHSAVMALARKYSASTRLARKNLVAAIQAIEKFHFQFNALTSSSSTGGTRNRYNRFAVDLEACKSRSDFTRVTENLIAKLAESLPPRENAEAAFLSLFYAPKARRLTRTQKRKSNKPFIAYILMGFQKHGRIVPAGIDPISYSIEHIKPQSNATGKVDDPVYSIGNLILLTDSLNGEIADSDFSAKAEVIDGTWSLIDPMIKSWIKDGKSSLSGADVKERAVSMANRAMSEVWAL